MHVDPRMEVPELHLGGAVVAPLIVRGARRIAGRLLRARARIRPEDTRVVGDAAQLVSAQLELAAVEEQEERLARAELRAAAQISRFLQRAGRGRQLHPRDRTRRASC